MNLSRIFRNYDMISQDFLINLKVNIHHQSSDLREPEESYLEVLRLGILSLTAVSLTS